MPKHRQACSQLYSQLKCTPIPILDSNYVWLIENESTKEIYIVDPGSSKEVLSYIRSNKLTPIGILITHSHQDHIAGVEDITQHFQIPVYGPDCRAISTITHTLYEADTLRLWDEIDCNIMHLPGHLPEHIGYVITEAKREGHLFCGDVLFSSGCGRMFVGTAKEYQQSIARLAKLDPLTKVYCTHEYTIDNLRFAKYIEPNNLDIDIKQANVEARLATHYCSLPSTIANEKLTNPFVRTDVAAVRARAEQLSNQTINNNEETFAALRSLKDRF